MQSLINTINERLALLKTFPQDGFCVCSECGREKAVKLNSDGVKEYDLDKPCKCGNKNYKVLPLIENDNYVCKILEELAIAYRAEIHEYLVPQKNKEAVIRAHIRDIMMKVKPVYDGRIRTIKMRYNNLASKCTNYNKAKLQDKVNALNEKYFKYLQIKDDFTALIAFRHFETFCLYIDEVYSYKVFTPSLHLFQGFYYYANSMVLNGDVKFIEKQCFAGAGKSMTDNALIAFIYGVDKDADVYKVFGSADNISSCMTSILAIMCSKKYAKVFPYYEKFDGLENQIFSIDTPAKGELKINGATGCPVSLRVRSKGDKTDGIRAKYLFLDDITLASDAEKLNQHTNDIFLYTNRWFKRKYDNNNFYIIASGTTYHQEDLLSHLKNIYGVDQAKPTKFKFTSISKSNEIVPNGISVFCVIYGLDEFDKSTYEAKFPTEAFKLEREKDPRMFAAMVQQQPQPPLGSPFDYDNLPHLYGKGGIPHIDRELETCTASLDPARKGKDFHSMPVIVEIDNFKFLQDCIFEQCAPDKLPLKVVDMIEKHHIVQLDIENNTDTNLDTLIKKMLKERGIEYCKVTSFFSYKKKDDKIAECETAIKSVFYPEKGVYSPNSAMGRFMYWFTAYNYEKPPKHDDSVDSMANYSLKFILNKAKSSKVKVLSRRR